LNPIQRLQNRAVRLVAGLSRQHSSSDAYKELKVLKFDDIDKVGLFTYCHFNNKLPCIFDNFFIKLSECHVVNTRRQAIGCN